ncbi:MAG: hypothetical protein KA152_15745 [Verrucomicrobiales bacterium]|nr:hypothetical protein [Verrucomicrobiales bacterium]
MSSEMSFPGNAFVASWLCVNSKNEVAPEKDYRNLCQVNDKQPHAAVRVK